MAEADHHRRTNDRAIDHIVADTGVGSGRDASGSGLPHEHATGTRRRATVRLLAAPADLTSGPIASTLWRLTVPLAFGFVINAVYSWINMFFVSRLGPQAIAALGVGDQINFVIFTLGSGFCIGTGIVVARRVGEERTRQASVVATQAFSFIALYAVVIALLVWMALPFALGLLGLTGDIRDLSEVFISTLLIGFPASLLIFQANASVRSTGNTVFPMTVLLITAIINVVLDPLLIFGLLGLPALGVRGAAIATATAQWIGAIISASVLFRGKLNIRLYRLTLAFDWDLIRSIFRLGIPASAQGLAVAVTRVLLIALAARFGTDAAAAYTIGLRVDVLVYMPIFATGIAIETLVSQNIGARRYDRVKAFRVTAIRHLSAILIGAGAIIFLLAEPISRIFSNDPEVVRHTVEYLHIAVFGYLFFTIGQTATRALSGAGHALRSMLITMAILFLVQIPLAYFLALGTPLGVSGIFLAITGSFLFFALVGTAAIRGDSWMRKVV